MIIIHFESFIKLLENKFKRVPKNKGSHRSDNEETYLPKQKSSKFVKNFDVWVSEIEESQV